MIIITYQNIDINDDIYYNFKYLIDTDKVLNKNPEIQSNLSNEKY